MLRSLHPERMRVAIRNPMTALLLLALSGLSACSRERPVSQSIAELLHEEQPREIRLAEVTSFRWDAMYFFGGYTPREHMCETLQITMETCPDHIPFESVYESHVAMVFVANGRPVHVEQHPNGENVFAPLPAPQALTPRSAVFRVVGDRVASTGEPYVRLVWQQP